MARVRPLVSPPIQEALIDLVLSGNHPSRDELQGLSSRLLRDGWQSAQIDTYQAEFNSGGTSGEMLLKAKPRQFEGFSLASPDGQRVFQLRSGRVTASHIRSYDRWEHLEDDVLTLLAAYVEAFGPRKVVRMAARFINRLQLPDSPGRELSKILTRPPQPPIDVEPEELSDFLSQQVLRGLPGGLTANVGIGTSSSPEGEATDSLVLDVDVFKICDEDATPDAIRGQLKQIRETKNALFFGSLSEEALEPYR